MMHEQKKMMSSEIMLEYMPYSFMKPDLKQGGVMPGFFKLFPVFVLMLLNVQCALSEPAGPSSPAGQRRQPPAITRARITGGFWGRWENAVREGSFPNAWPHVDVALKQMRQAAGLPVTGEVSMGHKWMEANVYKLLEAMAYYLAVHDDPDLEKQLDDVIQLAAQSQQADGFLHAWVFLDPNRKPWANLYHQHDGYVMGHMFEAAVAHHQATGKKHFLAIAEKAAQQACNHFLGSSGETMDLAEGVEGRALAFDGGSRHAVLPRGIVNGLDSVTIACWIKPNAEQTWARIFDFGTGTDVNMFLTPNSANRTLRFAITAEGGLKEERVDAPALTAGKWQHVALTLSEGKAILYVDGKEAGRNDALRLTPKKLGDTTCNYLGLSQYAGDPKLDGLMDDFRIYADALPPLQVKILHHARGQRLLKAGCFPKLKLWYRFETSDGHGLADSSGLGNTGKIEAGGRFPGHAEIELALVRLARATGTEQYTNLARFFVEDRGHGSAQGFPAFYFQDHVPFIEQTEIRGHAVRALFFASGVAEVALQTGRTDYVAAARALYRSAAHRKLYITGGAGASHNMEAFADDYDLPNTGYTESCANCAMADLAWRLLLLGENGAGDVLETCLYNHVLHGIALDGRTYYYRNPLRDHHHPRGNNWCCCPPTLMRSVLQFPKYSYATSGDCLDINLYGQTEATVDLKGGRVKVVQETDFPWDGKVGITFTPEGSFPFMCRLRIPAWCDRYTLTLNGKPLADIIARGDHVSIQRTWQPGDRVVLNLNMPVQRYAAHPGIKDNKGRVAIRRGPIIYSLESCDNPDIKEPGNVALPNHPAFKVVHDDHLLGGVTTIQCKDSAGRTLTLIPFYAVANRNPGKDDWRCVWLKQDGMAAAEDWGEDLYKIYTDP